MRKGIESGFQEADRNDKISPLKARKSDEDFAANPKFKLPSVSEQPEIEHDSEAGQQRGTGRALGRTNRSNYGGYGDYAESSTNIRTKKAGQIDQPEKQVKDGKILTRDEGKMSETEMTLRQAFQKSRKALATQFRKWQRAEIMDSSVFELLTQTEKTAIKYKNSYKDDIGEKKAKQYGIALDKYIDNVRKLGGVITQDTPYESHPEKSLIELYMGRIQQSRQSLDAIEKSLDPALNPPIEENGPNLLTGEGTESHDLIERLNSHKDAHRLRQRYLDTKNSRQNLHKELMKMVEKYENKMIELLSYHNEENIKELFGHEPVKMGIYIIKIAETARYYSQRATDKQEGSPETRTSDFRYAVAYERLLEKYVWDLSHLDQATFKAGRLSEAMLREVIKRLKASEGTDSLALSAAMYESQRSLGEFYRCVKGREYEVLDEIKRRYRVELKAFITSNHFLEEHIRGELDTNLRSQEQSSSGPPSGFGSKTIIASLKASGDDKHKSLPEKSDPTVPDKRQAGQDGPTKLETRPERRITFVDSDERQAGQDGPTKQEKGKRKLVESIDPGTSPFQTGPKLEISEVLPHYIETLQEILKLEKYAKEVIKVIKK